MINPKFTIELYTIDTINSKFNLVDIITRYESLNFTRAHNKRGNCVITFNLNDTRLSESQFTRYRTKVLIKYLNTPLWIGFVYKRQFNTSPDANSYTVLCFDYLGYLESRTLEDITVYKDTELGLIAWNLIDTIQNYNDGEYMIRQGSIQTTVTGNRSYDKFSIIATLLKNLSNVQNGIDFDFVPILDADQRLQQVNFNVWQNRGNLRSNVILNRNTLESVNATDYVDIGNYVNVVGQGSGEAVPTGFDFNSGLAKSYSRIDQVLQAKNSSVVEELNNKASDYININGTQNFYASFNLKPGIYPISSFNLNDTVFYDFTDFNSNLLRGYDKGSGRIESIDYNINKEGTIRFNPYIRLQK